MRLIAVGVGLALAGILVAAGFGARAATQAFSCTGKQVTLFNNTNGDLVSGGGAAPGRWAARTAMAAARPRSPSGRR